MSFSAIVESCSLFFFSLSKSPPSLSLLYNLPVEEHGPFVLQSFLQSEFYWLNIHMQFDTFHCFCKLAEFRGLLRLRFNSFSKAIWVVSLPSSWGTYVCLPLFWRCLWLLMLPRSLIHSKLKIIIIYPVSFSFIS